MKKLAAVFLGTLTASTLAFAATLSSLDKDQVTHAFVNKSFTSIATVRINSQEITDVFTGKMDDQGKIQGKFQHKPTQGPQMDQGVYTIKDNGQLCITWDHWENTKDEKAFCVYTFDTKNAYIMVGNDNVFHTIFMKADIK